MRQTNNYTCLQFFFTSHLEKSQSTKYTEYSHTTLPPAVESKWYWEEISARLLVFFQVKNKIIVYRSHCGTPSASDRGSIRGWGEGTGGDLLLKPPETDLLIGSDRPFCLSKIRKSQRQVSTPPPLHREGARPPHPHGLRLHNITPESAVTSACQYQNYLRHFFFQNYFLIICWIASRWRTAYLPTHRILCCFLLVEKDTEVVWKKKQRVNTSMINIENVSLTLSSPHESF